MDPKIRKKRLFNKSLATLGLALTASSVAPLLQAQVLEEVLVTATKRAMGLQDVPIAISVMSGDNIEAMGMKNLEDVVVYMPNVHVSESAGASQIYIRGVGSANNYGFEQSVGTFIDLVYFGRARNARAAFLDVERVEVLKGPQSTLFGKNTVAGAINITSRKPTDEFEAYVEGSYKTEVEGYGVTAAVSGPLTDNLRGRLIGKVYEDDGWMDNSAPGGEDGPARDDSVVRGILEWDATENLQVMLKAEYGEFNVKGRSYKIIQSTPTANYLFSQGTNPNFADTVGINEKQSVDYLPGNADFDDTDSTILQLNLNYQLGEHTLRSITAYTEYEFDNCIDGDYSSLTFLDSCRNEEHTQFTQEFLLSSPTGGTIEYLAGVFYQDADLDHDAATSLYWSGLPPVEPVLLGAVGGLPSGSLDTVFFNNFEQNSETWSVFASVTWNITDAFRTQFGLRYSDDSKDARKSQITTNPGTGEPDPFLAFFNGPAVLGFAEVYEYDESRAEDHWTGNINFQYDVNDDIMTYLNFSNGYKAGGYDSSNALDRSREFEDESVESIEFGLKMNLWENRARVNMAMFYTEYSDLQVSGYEVAGFIVGNAAESEVKGLEADFQVAATENLTIDGAFAYLDTEYQDYPNAACTVDQIVGGLCAANGGFQDLAGTRLQFSPELSGHIGASYDLSLTDSINLSLRADALFADDQVIAPDGDSNVDQDSYWKYNARIALQSSDGSWMLAVVGKNLSDETTINWGNDATLAGFGLGFESAYFGMIEAPRTFEFQARYNF